jgi:hypothetical protein
MTGRQVARLWHQLMTVVLGYDRFVAHGSDLGATFPPSPSLSYWPAAYATHFARCDTGVEPRDACQVAARSCSTKVSMTSERCGLHEM